MADTLSCQWETLHSQQLRSIKKSIDSDHGIYRYCEGRFKMKLPRRNFLHLAAGVAALPAVSRIARAQTYPTRPVRIIVGFPAGLGPGITARLIAQLLSERFGQSFIVDNRPSAGSNIGTEIVVRAPADGYTLLLM